MLKEVKDYELLKRVAKYASRLNKIERHNCKSSPVEYDELLEYYNRKINDKDNKVLAYIVNDEIKGVAALDIQPDNKYMQTVGGIFAEYNYQEIAKEFFKYINKNYVGYEFYSAYSGENIEAIKFMKSMNAECVDDNIIYAIDATHHNETKNNVIDLDEEYYNKFAQLHSKNFPDMYWNSERLLNSKEKFEIKVMIQDAEIIGYVVTSIWRKDGDEIYASYTKDNNFNVLFDLINAALNTAKLNNDSNYTVYSDKNDELEQKVLIKCGFKKAGTSVCYHIDKI